MIGKLSGVLLEKSPPSIVLDVGGVGYEVDVPMSTFYHLPSVGEAVSLYTHFHFTARADTMQLFGFLTEVERRLFRQLIKVGGIGARMALAILSGLSVDELTTAVSAKDHRRLVQIPGIGRKTAERLLLELRDKLTAAALSTSETASASTSMATSDILNALLALGYREREALAAMVDLPADVGVSEGIRTVLQKLAG